MQSAGLAMRALQLGESPRHQGAWSATTSFSTNPLAFRTSSGGTVVLFKSGGVVFINMTPIEEEELIRGLGTRIIEPLAEREIEVDPGSSLCAG